MGLQVQGEGNLAVIAALKDAGCLLRLEDYQHKYPYDWRTKKPTIFRATDQWFASVDGFKEVRYSLLPDCFATVAPLQRCVACCML